MKGQPSEKFTLARSTRLLQNLGSWNFGLIDEESPISRGCGETFVRSPSPQEFVLDIRLEHDVSGGIPDE